MQTAILSGSENETCVRFSPLIEPHALKLPWSQLTVTDCKSVCQQVILACREILLVPTVQSPDPGLLHTCGHHECQPVLQPTDCYHSSAHPCPYLERLVWLLRAKTGKPTPQTAVPVDNGMTVLSWSSHRVLFCAHTYKVCMHMCHAVPELHQCRPACHVAVQSAS